jgi:hypothetical protein
MLADPRTIALVTKEEKEESLKLFKELYVSFATTAVDWEKKDEEADVVVVEEPQQKKKKVTQMLSSAFDDDDDDDDDYGDDDEGASASKSAAAAAVDYGVGFDKVFKNYRRYCLSINWPATFPEQALEKVFSIMILFNTIVIN